MRIFKRIALGLLCLVIVTAAYAYTFGLWIYDIPSAARALPETLKESERLGLPMTAAELTAPLKVREEHNAAPGTIRFARTLDGLNLHPDYAADPEAAPEKTAALNAALAKFDRELTAVQSELAKPGWYTERDYDIGVNLLFPDYPGLKRLAQIYASRSIFRAREGDVEGTLADLTAIRHLRAHLSREPALISLLVAIAIDTIRFNAIGTVAETWSSDVDSLDLLQDAVDPDKFRFDPVHAFRGEFYFGLTTARQLKSLGGAEALSGSPHDSIEPKQIPPEDLVRSGLPEGRWQRAMMQPLAEAWNEVMAYAATQPKPLRGAGFILDRKDREMASNFRWSYTFTGIMLPVFSQGEVMLTASDIRPAAYEAMIEAAKFKRRTGRWPADLLELDLQTSDPFDGGRPLRLIVRGDQVAVYSLGRNGKDDNGLRRDTKNPGADDVAAWLGRAPSE